MWLKLERPVDDMKRGRPAQIYGMTYMRCSDWFYHEVCLWIHNDKSKTMSLISNEMWILSIVVLYEYERFARYNIHHYGPSMMCCVDTRTHD